MVWIWLDRSQVALVADKLPFLSFPLGVSPSVSFETFGLIRRYGG